MEIEIPIHLTYDVAKGVALRDVIASLSSIESLIAESSANLEYIIVGSELSVLNVQFVKVSQDSPLKEIVVATLLVTFQKQLETSVSKITKDHVGLDVPQDFQTLFTIAVVATVLYGAHFLYELAATKIKDTSTEKMLRAMIQDISERTQCPPEEVERRLRERYRKPSRIRRLANAVIKLIKPSVAANNASITMNNITIGADVIREIPPEYRVVNALERKKHVHIDDAKLVIHAQDRDRGEKGWAATVPGEAPNRIPLKLLDGVEPSEVWQKEEVRGNIVIVHSLRETGWEPSEIHLTELSHGADE